MLRLMPARATSYYASLLEALKPKRTAYSKISPFGDVITTPTPAPDRAVHRYRPSAGRFRCICICCFDNKVRQCLGPSRARPVVNVKFWHLYCPLEQSVGRIKFMESLFQGLVGDNLDGMGVEVWSQLFRRYEHDICHILHQFLPLFCSS